ncbi:hypothetical protein ACJ41O_005711 [Fusarium nematophilum]
MPNDTPRDTAEDSVNRFPPPPKAVCEVEDGQLQVQGQGQVQNEDKVPDLDQGQGQRTSQDPAGDGDKDGDKDQDQNHLPARADLEFHYNESSTAGRLLTDILLDLVSFKEPQNWDKLQHTNQLKKVATSAKRYLETLASGEASELLNYSTVEDVSILNKVVARRPVGSSSESYFFPSKAPNLDIPDLKRVEPFEPMQAATAKDSWSLCQVSSSVLLTFVLPEESTSRREELDFLTTPQALWTVLTINCMRRRGSNSGDVHEAPPTPVAQFMAGIHGALQTQRLDEQHILDALRSRLAESDDMRLVDDDKFSKSHLYHWVVKTCDKVCHSISTTLRFIDRISRDFVTKLGAEGHAFKPPGIETWQEKWMQEVADLKELREEFLSCRQDVQERVEKCSMNSLNCNLISYSLLSSMEQQQSSKLVWPTNKENGSKFSHIWPSYIFHLERQRINPLPQSATMGSYFIFLVILFLVTALVGAGITNLSTKTSAATGVSGNFFLESWRFLAGWLGLKYNKHLANYLRYLKAIFTPPSAESSSGLSVVYKFDPPASKYWDEEWGWSRIFFEWFYKFCDLPRPNSMVIFLISFSFAFCRFLGSLAMAPNTDIATRALVVALKAPCSGKPTEEVAAITGLSVRQVNRIYARAIERGFDPNLRPIVVRDDYLRDAPRSGRPMKRIEEA